MVVHVSQAVNGSTPFERPTDALLALYLHIPFCQTRCSYCAFNTYTGQSERVLPYVHALIREIRWVAGQEQPSAHTIYFGGGTPSLLPAAQIEAIVNGC